MMLKLGPEEGDARVAEAGSRWRGRWNGDGEEGACFRDASPEVWLVFDNAAQRPRFRASHWLGRHECRHERSVSLALTTGEVKENRCPPSSCMLLPSLHPAAKAASCTLIIANIWTWARRKHFKLGTAWNEAYCAILCSHWQCVDGCTASYSLRWLVTYVVQRQVYVTQ